MPATEANPSPTETRTQCPLCDAALDPTNPNECPKCDWVPGYRRRTYGGTARDTTAMLASIIPGLGHIYKGHRLMGALFMLGGLFAIFWGSLAATATMGLGLILIPLYWAGMMVHAYWLDDRKPPSPQ